LCWSGCPLTCQSVSMRCSFSNLETSTAISHSQLRVWGGGAAYRRTCVVDVHVCVAV
jgi:hypothetical protein